MHLLKKKKNKIENYYFIDTENVGYIYPNTVEENCKYIYFIRFNKKLFDKDFLRFVSQCSSDNLELIYLRKEENVYENGLDFCLVAELSKRILDNSNKIKNYYIVSKDNTFKAAANYLMYRNKNCKIICKKDLNLTDSPNIIADLKTNLSHQPKEIQKHFSCYCNLENMPIVTSKREFLLYADKGEYMKAKIFFAEDDILMVYDIFKNIYTLKMNKRKYSYASLDEIKTAYEEYREYINQRAVKSLSIDNQFA